MENAFHRTRAAVESGIAEGLHPGAQVYLSLRGEPLLEFAAGEAQPGRKMTSDSLTCWFSAGKPLTALAVGRLVDRGDIAWDTTVATVIPEFSRHGKQAITLRHVLTHTAGLHAADELDDVSWQEKIARICDTPLPEGWVPGERAAYSASGGWFILGEIVERVTGEPVASHVRNNVAVPLGMKETMLCLDATSLQEHRFRLALMYDTRTETPASLSFWNTDEGLQRCIPGGSTRGPIRELGRFYERILAGGDGVVSRRTIAEMTRRDLPDLLDETFRYRMNRGLGFILNSNRDGMQMPYGYGRNASPATFGHSGNQSSCGFADPETGLVVAWVCNGLPGERRHQQRQRLINDAIRTDLFGENR